MAEKRDKGTVTAAEIHAEDIFEEPENEEEDEYESYFDEIKKRRKVLRGKITRSIRRVTEQINMGLLAKRSADKELSDLRRDFDIALELHGALFDHEPHQDKLEKWETELIRDIHSIEIKVEDYFLDKDVKRDRSGPELKADESPPRRSERDNSRESKLLEETSFEEKDDTGHKVPCIQAIDSWIDNLVEFEETVHQVVKSDISVADALYRLESSRDIPSVKLMTFDGSPMRYVEFIESFYIHIHNKINLSDDQRMMQLKMHLTGDAAKAVSGLGSSGMMYASTLKTIKDLYGHRSVIARAYINKLTKGERIRASDRHSLRAFSLDIVNCLATLKRINYLSDVNSTDTLRQIIRRLPDFLVTRWKSTVADAREKGQDPTLQTIRNFVEKQVKAEFDPDFGDIERPQTDRDRGRDRIPERVVNTAQRREFPCIVCAGNHRVYNCPTFLDSSVYQRIDLIKQHKLCYSCLNKGHITRDCRIKRACGKNGCLRTHHVLIHIEPQRVGGASVLDQSCILPVVRAKFRSENGRVREGNILIDGGAGTTLIRKQFAHMLGLQGKKEDLEIGVVGGDRHCSRGSRRVKCWVSPLEGGEEFMIEAHELDKTVASVPPLDRTWLSSFGYMKDITFSHKAGPVDLILGVQYSHLHAEQDIREGLPYQPVAKRTRLGWCVIGPEVKPAIDLNVSFCEKIENPNLDRMYEIETVGVQAPDCKCPRQVLSKEDKMAMSLMRDSCRKEGKRYVIGLPWKKDKAELPDNYDQAFKRLTSLEKSLAVNQKKAELYQRAMNEYIQNGIAELTEENAKGVTIYYLPHHGVYRMDKPSTPLRIVFDPASTFQGASLNSFLYKGPSLLGDLLGILLRFREKAVAFQGDISKMFLQICLPEEDTQVHRFLWRNLDVTQKPSVYRLKRVTFGDKPSPDMANYVMLKIADDHETEYPDAVEVLRSDRYMDDIIHSCENREKAKELMRNIDVILDSGSFKIKKWYSSVKSDETQHVSGMIDLSNISSSLNSEEKVKTLGVLWDCESDTIHFKVNLQVDGKLTKRIVLSRLSMIYDPLGLATITTIRTRIAMQELWKNQDLGWDDLLIDKDCEKWTNLFNDLKNLNNVCVQRCLNPHGATSTPELHVFCDASLSAYGACAYLLWRTEGNTSVHLVAAKARVSPLKQTTIPRLELMGALLASRLARTVYKQLRVTPQVFLWTDSQIVLRWLHSESTEKKAFVGVRIAEIQTVWDVQRWKFVPTEHNPADELSRGVKVCDISYQWFCGPSFLHGPMSEWPDQSWQTGKNAHEHEEDKNPKQTCSVTVEKQTVSVSFIDCTRYSSWTKLLHVTAYCLRFIDNMKRRVQDRNLEHCLLPEEKRRAEILWIKECQREIKDWKATCVELSPFIDNDIIRVGGRLQHSSLTYDQIHPILLPSSHHVTKLILNDIHHNVCHGGVERTLSESRRKYWIIRGRNSVKDIVRKCTICRRLRQPVHETLMGDLPSARLKLFSPTFTTTGVDLFGPFYLKYGRNKKIKAWGALFTCATTRAIHLEIVESLSTTSFLHALRRFVARHGWPSVIISDNGTSFVGAQRELRSLVQKGQKDIQAFSSLHCVKWIFTTPLSPHQGGMYESLIKQAKRAIQVSVGDQTLSWNEMSTVFSEVENLLNSRPLGYCSNNPNDPQPLTPNHFILGRTSSRAPEGPFSESSSLGKRFDFIQVLLTQFWKRFVREYVPTLMRRLKWKNKGRQIAIGDIVIIADYNTSRGKWPLARVVEVFPGKDGIVRNVKIKTQFGEYKRAVQKCCVILESSDADCVN